MNGALRVLLVPVVLAASMSTLASTVCAQSVSAVAETTSVRAPAPPPPPDPGPEQLQEAYRRLYEVQLRLAAQESSASAVDSLRQTRAELIAEIEKLARQVERARVRRAIPRPPSGRGGDDLSVLIGELETLGSDIDWESISKSLELNAKSVGEGLAILGEQLKNLQVEIDQDRVRVDTGTGGRFTFTVPPEIKRDIGEGIREMSRELGRVLDDSTRQAFGSEFRLLLDELPAEVFGREGVQFRRPREKKVIAESVFQTWKDFEVGEDELVRGDVLLIGGDAYIAGEVQGNVYVLFGDLFVEGQGNVAADAISIGGRVRVEDQSEVHGRRFDISSVLPGFGIGAIGASNSTTWLLYSVRVAVLALLLVLGYALAGRRLEVMVEHGQDRLGRSLLAGSLWFSAALGIFVVAALGLAISVIGIPVVIVLTAAFVLIVLLAYFTGCEVVGDRMLHLFGGRVPVRPWQIALVGLALLEIPALLATVFDGTDVPVEMAMLLTALDFFVKFVVLGIGFGAVVGTRLGGAIAGIDRNGTEHLPLAPDR